MKRGLNALHGLGWYVLAIVAVGAALFARGDHRLLLWVLALSFMSRADLTEIRAELERWRRM